ncbi:MAG TPA: hypothetical protein VMB50_09360 [Myxococcales bacterium]|nr:hypothetical protein [Myxococcales bacterium]
MRRLPLVVLLAALPFGSCKCKGGLNNITGALTATPPSLAFGNVGIHSTKSLTTTIKNNGDAQLNIVLPAKVTGTNAAVFTPAPKFPADAGSATLIPLDIGQTAVLTVNYTPTAEESDTATVQVSDDTGDPPLTIDLTGTGKDPCYDVVCDAGAPNIDPAWHCFGSCDPTSGQCVYAGSCKDPSQCLSNGTCNVSTGACTGTSDCANPPATCSGNVLTGNFCSAGENCCNPGGFGTAQECHYSNTTVTCDCACVQNGNSASCAYAWQAAQPAPPTAGQVSSVWAGGQSANDLWLAEVTGNSGEINPNTVYQLQNGAWNQVAQVAGAYNPVCSGPGCGLSLVGSSDSDVYGAIDCTSVQSGTCAAGGAWHWTGSAADEAFSPATFPSCAVPANLPIATLFDLGGTGLALNSDCTGPELETGVGGSWTVSYNFHWYCQAPGALWGTATNDLWVSWGCQSSGSGGNPNPGQIIHYNGTGVDASSTFALPADGYADAMWGTGDGDIWAVGTNRWHYDGTAWSLDATPMPGGPDQTVWGNGSDYYAGGGYPQLYHWTSATDWTKECVYPGYGGPSITSFAYDGTNVFATATPTGSAANGELVQRCPGGQCQ